MKPPLLLAMAAVLCARSALCEETIVECDDLEGIANGVLRLRETVLRSKAIFKCIRGFKLVGNSTRTCGADGKWSGESPHCEAICVIQPGPGFHVLRNTSYGSRVQLLAENGTQVTESDNSLVVKCVDGYRFTRESLRSAGGEEAPLRCQGGVWHPPQPWCNEIVGCGPLESIDNGSVSLSGTVFDSKAEFSCNHGFKLVGNSSRTCDADGQWTGEYPRCEEIWCPEEMISESTKRGARVVVGNKAISGRQRSGTRVNYICPANTDLLGSDINICQENGSWLFDPPACKAKCIVPPGPGSQVQRRWSSWRKQWSAVESGTQVSESGSSLSVWSAVKPGTQVSESDSSLSVVCVAGYTFVNHLHPHSGEPKLQLSCQDGEWKPSGPWCTEMPCRIPTRLPEGVEAEQSWEVPHGQQVRFRCKRGYTMEDADYEQHQPRCLLGRIDGRYPSCKPDDCRIEGLPPVENGQPRKYQNVSHGSFAIYECNPSLELQPRGGVRCHLGVWLGTPPLCAPKKCVVPEHHGAKVQRRGGRIQGFWRTDVDVAPHTEVTEQEQNLFVTCTQGYHLLNTMQAKTQVVCKYGAWEPPPPWCTEDGCRRVDLPRVKNGRPLGDQFIAPNSLGTYECQPPFQLQGEGRIRCHGGRWQGLPPSCVSNNESNHEKKGCEFSERQESFKAHHKGIPVNPKGLFEHGTELVFHCEPVGELRFGGPRTARCIDGKWDPPQDPYCYDLKRYEIFVRFPNDTYTAPGGIVYVEPNKEVRVVCWSNTPVDLSLVPAEKPIAFSTWKRKNNMWMTFSLTRNTSANITCRHRHVTAGDHSRQITVLGQHSYRCPPITSNEEGLQITRRNPRTYHFTCVEGYKIVGKPYLHCLGHGVWSSSIPRCEPKSGASSNHAASPQSDQTESQTPDSAGPSGAAILIP